MSGLAEWLTAIWDGDEERLTGPTFCGPVWPTTDQLLARIAADRQILALHAPSGDECGTCCGEPYMNEYWDGEEEAVVWKRADLLWPCPTVRLLALRHADRPGYREDWKP